MKKLLPFLFYLFILSCSQTEEKFELETNTENGFSYEFVAGDPMGMRLYTLDNGLKVYLSQYKDAPRVQVYIPVKAGGKNDPADNTGLAHYLEHMMFKGTDTYGTIDFEKEKIYTQFKTCRQVFGEIKWPLKRKKHPHPSNRPKCPSTTAQREPCSIKPWATSSSAMAKAPLSAWVKRSSWIPKFSQPDLSRSISRLE
jgi:hypothetical protein